MQEGVTSEEGQGTISTRGLPVIARQFHERLSIAEMQSRNPEPMRFWSSSLPQAKGPPTTCIQQTEV